MQSLARALIVATTVSVGILAAAPPASAAPPILTPAADAPHIAAFRPTDISASRRHYRHDYRYRHYYRQPLPYEGYRPYPPPRFCYPPYYGYTYGYGPFPPFFSWGCGW